jgi:transcription-repair coupling factor (superfamily II helicase)
MEAMRSLFDPIIHHPAVRACLEAAAGNQTVAISGVTRTAKGLVIAALAHELGALGQRQTLLVLTSDNEAADSLRRSAAAFLEWLEPGAGECVDALPTPDCSPWDHRSPHAELLELRASTLWRLCQGTTRVLVAPVAAALGRFREPSHYRSLALRLRIGDEVPPEDLVEHLESTGYERSEPADGIGLYSVRGGIVDVYPPFADWPFRLEFFGDRIESIREFDPGSQRSRQSVDSALLLPLVEVTRRPGFFRDLIRVLANDGDPSKEPEWAPSYSERFPGWEFYAPLVEPHPHTLFSLSGAVSSTAVPEGVSRKPGVVLIQDEPIELRRVLERTLSGWAEAFEEVRDVTPRPPRPDEVFLSRSEFEKALHSWPCIELKELSVAARSDDPRNSAREPVPPGGDAAAGTAGRAAVCVEYPLLSQPSPKFRGAVKDFASDLRTRLTRQERVVLVFSGTGKVERAREILAEYGLPFTSADEWAKATSHGPGGQPVANTSPVYILPGELDEGVILPETRLTLLTDRDVFGGFDWAPSRRREKSAASRFISDLSDLKPGDYVVHVDHGIGLYQGLRTLEVGGIRRDFMLLTYQDDAKLYVPLERLDLVEKYRAGSGTAEAAKPALDRLGGTSWARTKTRVKRALRDMAEELLRLYAERKMAGGRATSPDTPWQKEFEEAFEFEETPDQLTSLAEIKRDLESPQPMDRLLCGDVGYGKTELAMRAAFKVVQDGRQVAVLAPTTVLAFQHYRTFRQRMAAFPVRVEMVSRFRSPAEQKQVLADTQAGKVDILIGTHRLLSRDVEFRDLGLLIVDEEQRFGVAAKEKLKRLRANVDVLTMSATPIPRTLHMSLGGLRDLSVIETPPSGRMAIQTLVAPFSDNLIQAAILQEMERGGQVYFVHNRVESIFSIASIIQRLVPSARLGVAHGQMGERELERVMLKFVEGGYDVLVTTAIIENGLDIPRANTIIVNRADRFGLADLYQLRGRVGRSDRRAYAYFLIPDEESLTPTAKRRLAALKEFSDLGAGFRLAALDLELRGAGNLLGAEQSGHLHSIGIDLYLKMLEETVNELRGKPPAPEVHTTLNLGLDIKIPEAYIPDEGQRLRMYKRISSLSTPEARADLEAELRDRFGPIPSSVHHLLDYALLKSTAEQLLVQSVERKADEIWLRFHQQAPVDPAKLTHWVRRHPHTSLRPDGVLRFRVDGSGDVLARIQDVLQELRPSP